ncbi:MAG: glutamine-hydrolyzing GMP synthase [Candidatus Gracilibacteria bacterium]|nr:glutamine-hydrolyzing GMP synthase [Candidatus Gracilibacteria bacterium]
MSQIYVIDLGGQYAHLIGNRVRRLGVYAEVRSNDCKASDLQDAQGIILSGGPKGVKEEGAPEIDHEIFQLGKPVLGICYGHQMMAHYLGGEIGTEREYGFTDFNISKKDSQLFQGLDAKQVVWNNHGDAVVKLPIGFEKTGSTETCEFESMENVEQKLYGVQFHPEVSHSEHGMKLLENFVLGICKCEKDWSIANFRERIEQEIKDYVGAQKVFLLVSGGVDSTVCFALLNQVLGPERVYGLHVDSGFMRQDESEKVKQMFAEIGYDNLHIYDAKNNFLKAVGSATEPEEKRRAIGEEFIRVAALATSDLELDPAEWILAQGTIYPDTIESGGSKHADRIKTHHNRVDGIQKLIAAGKLLEPIKDLYKDEVRELGIKLGLPEEMIYRHPFPGPGLAVRTLCAQQNEKLKIKNDPTLIDIVGPEISAQILPVKSVGVQGDARSYAHPALLEVTEIDWDKLGKVSVKITNSIREVNRVLVKLAGDSENLELQAATLTEDRLDLLRVADQLFHDELRKAGLYHEVWQAPVVLVPLVNEQGETIVLRPINSTEAMTANFAKLPLDFVKKVAAKILNLKGIGLVAYDITNKPPGTIEWE